MLLITSDVKTYTHDIFHSHLIRDWLGFKTEAIIG